jgi:hypothetical protein
MRLRLIKRDIFRVATTTAVCTPKIRPTRGSLRSDGCQGSSPLRDAPLVPRSASLTAVLATAWVLLWGACAPLSSTNEATAVALREGNW